MTDWPAIVARHGGAVWYTAYRLLGNADDAEDCFQETFVSALRVSRRHEVRSWAGLLRRLATARALDRLRQRRRRTRGRGVVADWEAVPSPNPGPGLQAEAAELSARLRRALSRLPAKQAQVFCLRCLEGMSYEEIAAELGIKPNAVGVLLHRGRARLRDLLGERGGG